MAKVRTFNIKIPKSVRDFQNKKSPLGQGMEIKRHGDFKIQEIPPGEQIRKLNKSIEYLEKRIKLFTERKKKHAANSEEYLNLEKKILIAAEHIAFKKYKRDLVNRKYDIEEKKRETKKEKLAQEMRGHIIGLAMKDQFDKAKDIDDPKYWREHWKDETLLPKEPAPHKRAGRNRMSLKPGGRKKRFAEK